MVKRIKLRSGEETIIDDDDFDAVTQWKWSLNQNGYAYRAYRYGGKIKEVFLHRFINKTPKGKQTDHVNGVKLDNRKKNLRSATSKENMANRCSVKGSSSRFKGVSLFKRNGKWTAQIRADGKLKYLGLFNKEEDAAMAYDEEAKKIHGKFARLNFNN